MSKKEQKSKPKTKASEKPKVVQHVYEAPASNEIIDIDRYKFCEKCDQLCPPNLVLVPGTETTGSYCILVDKCEYCGETKQLDNTKCYNIIL
jgi:MinD superfamily P-loop ATPase